MLLSKFPQFCGGLDKGLNNKPIVLFYNIFRPSSHRKYLSSHSVPTSFASPKLLSKFLLEVKKGKMIEIRKYRICWKTKRIKRQRIKRRMGTRIYQSYYFNIIYLFYTNIEVWEFLIINNKKLSKFYINSKCLRNVNNEVLNKI